MTLPLPLASVGPAACDAAIASLHELLGDRLPRAGPVREQLKECILCTAGRCRLRAID